MDNFKSYIDAVMGKAGIKSVNQLAIRLGISQSTVQTWIQAGRVPEDDACIKIAELNGDDPAKIIAFARSCKASPAARQYWDKILKSISAAALALFIVLSLAFPSSALASTIGAIKSNLTECILCKIRRFFRRLRFYRIPLAASLLICFISGCALSYDCSVLDERRPVPAKQIPLLIDMYEFCSWHPMDYTKDHGIQKRVPK